MNPERKPQASWKVRVATTASLGIAFLLAACRGGSEAGEPVNTDTSTPDNSSVPSRSIEPSKNPALSPIGQDGKDGTAATPLETQTPTKSAGPTPAVKTTPEATPFVPKSIFDAEITSTLIDEVQVAISSFYGDHPEAYDWKVDGAPFPQTHVGNNLKACQFGDPQDAGSPSLIAVDRAGACGNLIRAFDWFYREHKYEELYQMALAVRNYYFSEYPTRKAAFDKLLHGLGVN